MTTTVTTDHSGPLTANGVTPIPFDFQALSEDEISVTREGVVADPSTYVVTLSEDGTGSVTPTSSWSTDEVYVYSSPAFTQGTNFQRHGAFYPDQINTSLDKLSRQIISLLGGVGRGGLDPSVDRAGKYAAFDAAGLPIAASGTGGDSAFRTDAASPSLGATLVSFLQDGVGAVARTVRSKLRDTVNPLDFGATGDGTTDDATAILAAFTHASASKKYVDGGDFVYAVSGNLLVSAASRLWIKSLRLKQLTPANDRKTLYILNCQSVRIDQLEINLNTTKTLGGLSTSAGLWLEGGSNHMVRNVEVFGNGKGSGIVIRGTTHSTYDSMRARDMEYDNAAATDDQIQGIWLYENSHCVFSNLVVSNLFGNANVSFPNRFTRGIVLASSNRVTLVAPTVTDVDQGVDITGSSGNLDCLVIGGQAYQCVTVGLKFANSAVNCKAVGFISRRCGTHGYIIVGPAEAGLTNKTSNIDLVGCTAIDTGWNAFPGGSQFGFSVEAAAFDASYPKGVRFIGCRAMDTQAVKTMLVGFRNNVLYDADKKPNECIDCLSEGHTQFAQSGIHRAICRLTGTGNVSATNGVGLSILWDTEVEDTFLMHDAGSNTDRITIPVAGRWRVKAKITFAANGAGYRRVALAINGVNTILNASPATTGEITTVLMDEEIDATVGQYLTIVVEQNSGGALNVSRGGSFFAAELIRAA